MSLAELDGSGDAGTDALLEVEQAVRSRRSSWFATSRSRRSSCWCRSASPSVGCRGPRRAARRHDRRRRARDRGDRSRGGSASAVRPTRCAISPTRSTRCSTGSIRRADPAPLRRGRLARAAEPAGGHPDDPRCRARRARGRRGPAPRCRGGSSDGRPDVDHGRRAHGARRTSAQPERRTSVDLAEVVAEVAQEYDAEASTRGVRLSRLAPSGLVVDGDRSALKRAQANLVSNALRVAPPARWSTAAPGVPVDGCGSGSATSGAGSRPTTRPRLPPRLARRRSDGGGRRAGPGAGPRSPDRRGTRRHGQRGLGPRARRELRRVAAGPHGRCEAVPVASSGRWPTRSGRWTRPPDRSLGRLIPPERPRYRPFPSLRITGRTGIGPTCIRPYRSGGPLPWTTPSPATIVSTRAGATCRRPHPSSGPRPVRDRGGRRSPDARGQASRRPDAGSYRRGPPGRGGRPRRHRPARHRQPDRPLLAAAAGGPARPTRGRGAPAER